MPAFLTFPADATLSSGFLSLRDAFLAALQESQFAILSFENASVASLMVLDQILADPATSLQEVELIFPDSILSNASGDLRSCLSSLNQKWKKQGQGSIRLAANPPVNLALFLTSSSDKKRPSRAILTSSSLDILADSEQDWPQIENGDLLEASQSEDRPALQQMQRTLDQILQESFGLPESESILFPAASTV